MFTLWEEMYLLRHFWKIVAGNLFLSHGVELFQNPAARKTIEVALPRGRWLSWATISAKNEEKERSADHFGQKLACLMTSFT
jgi:hypothetical protein